MLSNRFLTFIFSAVLLLSSCHKSGEPGYVIHKSATSGKGMVVTAHPLASEAGLSILTSGGNAADAAIAVQFVLAVVYPRAGNIGGGGFMVYRSADGKVLSLDYREKAPMAAHRDMYLDATGQVIEKQSIEGLLAAGIPGTVAGLVEMHKKLGRLQPWSRLVEPAIELAEKGFHITALEAARLNTYREDFKKYNTSPMPFLKAERWKPGDVLVQKELAATLRRIAGKGREAFYSGSVAENLLELNRSQGGIMTAEDLASYQAVWREPLSLRWRKFTLHTMGLPSSGGMMLHQILHMVEPHMVDSLEPHSWPYVHLLVEAERRAYADRALFLGDPDFYPVAVDSLLDPTYSVNKFKDFNPEAATESQSIYAEKFQLLKESFETTHVSIVDQDENAVSVTTTLNNNYGCKVWVPGGGFFLNSEMDDFSIKPGVPNIYGLIGGEANAIAPEKRMLSSMTPTIVEKDGNLWLVVGTPGGSTIITSVLQVFLNLAVFDMSVDEAVQSPRFHHQWLPDEIMVEPGAFSKETSDQLERMGHRLRPVDYIGLVEAVMVDERRQYHGAADRRGDDHAAGW